MEASFVTVLVAEPAHDRLRRLLAEHGGREVRATREELTAAFPSAVVRRALCVRDAASGRRRRAADRPRRGRGVEPRRWSPRSSAGSPTTVEILASEVVRLVARETGLLQPAGAYKLRGVDERVAVSRVSWDGEPAPAEPARASTITRGDRRRRAAAAGGLPRDPRRRGGPARGRRGRRRARGDRRRPPPRPDVVLMDVRMPELDGLEAARRILDDPDNGTAVVMLTTFDLVAVRLRGAARRGQRLPAQGRARPTACSTPCASPPPATRCSRRRSTRRADRGVRARAARRPGHGAVAPRGAHGARARGPAARSLAGSPTPRSPASWSLGENTIKTHVARMLRKLGVRDRAQAVVLAYETGLVVPEGDGGP